MNPQLTVFINGRPVSVPPGATAGDAVEALDPSVAARAREGRALLTDGVGRTMALTAPLAGGAILRVIMSGDPPDESA
ncbi:MAG TPA: hypothetical protein VGI83_05335 [Gemmatimonadales bacterium]|jgi:hypothetical protein